MNDEVDRLISLFPFASSIERPADAEDRLALQWFLAMDKSAMVNSAPEEPPYWVPEKFKWGPSPWPVRWSEVAESKMLDCGCLANLAFQLLQMRGAFWDQVQVILKYSPDVISHWKAFWSDKGGNTKWIGDGYYYHEAVMRIDGMSGRIWDPTEGVWLDQGSKAEATRGRIVALRSVSTDGARILDRDGDHVLATTKREQWVRFREVA